MEGRDPSIAVPNGLHLGRRRTRLPRRKISPLKNRSSGPCVRLTKGLLVSWLSCQNVQESLNVCSDSLLRRYHWQRFGNEMTIMEASLSSPVDHPKVGRLREARQSRITNGRDLLPDIDGRSAIARRYRDITNAILGDQGGIDRCSESRLQLIRRFAAAAVLAEQMESRLANGETIDINEHATLSSTLVRLSAKIGINRLPRDVTPSLVEYLAAKEETDADHD